MCAAPVPEAQSQRPQPASPSGPPRRTCTLRTAVGGAPAGVPFTRPDLQGCHLGAGSPAALASLRLSDSSLFSLHLALQCEGGQVYEACGPTCPPTCHDRGPESGWHCQAVTCVEGCFCPEGTLLHGV